MTDTNQRRAAHRAGIATDLLARDKAWDPVQFFPNAPLALGAGLQDLGFVAQDVTAGKRYAYRIVLHCTISAVGSVAAGSFNGTATASAHSRAEDAVVAGISTPTVAAVSDASMTSQLTAVASTPGAYAVVVIEGQFNCSGSGQIAPNATVVAGLSVLNGSSWTLNEF